MSIRCKVAMWVLVLPVLTIYRGGQRECASHWTGPKALLPIYRDRQQNSKQTKDRQKIRRHWYMRTFKFVTDKFITII